MYIKSIVLCLILSITAKAEVAIFVVDNGVHTEIVVPIKNEIMDWREFVPLEKINYKEKEQWNYLAFGWGDRGFYVNTPDWEDLTLHIAIAALFLPTPTVMRVEGFNTIRQGKYVKKLTITDEQYRKLTDHIKSSFKTTNEGNLTYVAEGHGVKDAFFKATGIYFLFYTSNTWTAGALRKTGIDMPRGVIFSESVMQALDKLDR